MVAVVGHFKSFLTLLISYILYNRILYLFSFPSSIFLIPYRLVLFLMLILTVYLYPSCTWHPGIWICDMDMGG